MQIVADIAAIVVGVVFVVAGASKLAAGDGWRAQADGLGAPAFAVGPLPWLEIVIGAVLMVQLAAPVAAIAAVALLIAFTILLLIRLAQGERPACACFGAWSAKPIGPGHIVRNTILLALAIVAIWA